MTGTECDGLPLNQMVPGHYIITPSSSPSFEYQATAMAMALELTSQALAVSSRTIESSRPDDVGQTSMISTSRKLLDKTSLLYQPDIGNNNNNDNDDDNDNHIIIIIIIINNNNNDDNDDDNNNNNNNNSSSNNNNNKLKNLKV